MKSFKDEEELREYLIAKLSSIIKTHNLPFKILESKNVTDIIITKENETLPIIAFLEVKYVTASKGRVGIGDKEGKGFQVEILKEKFIYLERYARWIIVKENNDATFVNNETIRKCIHGGEENIGECKQHNININKLKFKKLDEVIKDMINWLKTI